MAYSDFTLATVKQTFDLTLGETEPLFRDLEPVPPPESLTHLLAETLPLAIAINTGKARSELLITPILLEVRRLLNFQVSYFSGVEFNVDPSRGLSGRCDFILSKSPEQLYISAPVVTIMEAKNEDVKGGLGQCVAAMVAAQLFNQQSQEPIQQICGAVTTGTIWRFLKLTDKRVQIDVTEYYINQLEWILAALLDPLRPAAISV